MVYYRQKQESVTKVGIKGNLHYNSDGNNKDSLSNRFRRKRMKVFEEFFESTFADELKSGKTIRILDIGGRNRYWNSVGFKYISNCEFTLLNLKAAELDNTGDRRFSNKIGDATDMKDIADNSYDLVFSNSCIEHVGKKPQWEKMRNEMLRTGRYYFLQTPNKYFPMEPHFLFLGFQFLPLKTKAFILKHFRHGWFAYIETYEQAYEAADSIHLLTQKDLKALFPKGTIRKERFLGITKSFMVMGKASD